MLQGKPSQPAGQGGTAAPTNGILTITGTYNQAIIANVGELTIPPSMKCSSPILTAAIVLNLAVLGVFKYSNFAASNLALLLGQPMPEERFISLLRQRAASQGRQISATRAPDPRGAARQTA